MNWLEENKRTSSLYSERTRLENALSQAEEEYDDAMDKLRELEVDIKLARANVDSCKRLRDQLRKQLANY